ncbi:NUDIX domain-containing protein [Aquimarina brevivitae]|uniref:GDP-mannose pyrophosphatase n=1 Tax=Aquimarina brevivitae TaxID=323412 RepID=A0A4Q7P0N6_9FLAO|nr:NUDIX hydrolase [Aquimarina brevivitae]RZS93363.1 ADP-ribose pyrophosphatase [Aquimarina brevivitae]
MKYTIHHEEVVYNGFLQIKKAQITHDRFHHQEPISYDREVLDKGDCIAVLLFEKDTNCIILIKQFRYPTVKHTTGWFVELPAGAIEDNEDPKNAAYREVEEETGYTVAELEHIQTFYATPGSSTERMFLFYGEVTTSDKEAAGGGASYEDEDIEIVKLPVAEIPHLLQSHTLPDAKTIIALQWFLMQNKLKF